MRQSKSIVFYVAEFYVHGEETKECPWTNFKEKWD